MTRSVTHRSTQFTTLIPFALLALAFGTQAQAARDSELEHLVHLALLNRGVLITPFHNMLLVCPDTTPADVALLLAALDDVLGHIT